MNILDLKRRLLPFGGFLINDGDGMGGRGNNNAGGRNGGGDSSGGGNSDSWGAYGGAGWSTQGYTTGDNEPSSDTPSEAPGWSAARDSQAAFNTMAEDRVATLGVTNEQAQTALGAVNGEKGEVSPGGVTYSEARSYQDQGLGNLKGVNPHNDQTVDQVMASQNFHHNVMPVAIGLLQSAVPGASMAMNAAKRIGAVTSGAQTVGQALGNFAVDTVGNYAAGKINGAINSATDGLYGQAGLISSSFGLGLPNIGREVVNGVVNSTGIRPGGMQSIGSPAADNGISSGNGAVSNPNIPQTPTTPNVPTAPTAATPAVPYEDIDINMWGGMTPEKWAAAAKKLNISFGG